jgi:hypothetical protein
MKLKIDVDNEEIFTLTYLDIYGVVRGDKYKLSDKEKELLLVAALIYGDDKYKHQLFAVKGKNRIMEEMEKRGFYIKKNLMSTRIYSLLDKGFLYRDEDGIIYLPVHFRRALDEFRKYKIFTFTLVYENNTDRRGDNKENGTDTESV